MTETVKALTGTGASRRAGARPTVASSYVRSFLEFANERGADAPGLIAAAGLSAGSLNDPDTRVAMADFLALMRRAKADLADPALALRFGEDNRLYDQTIVGLIIRSSPTMGEAFAQFNRYARIVIHMPGARGGDRVAVVRADGKTFLEAQWPPLAYPEMTEATFARLAAYYDRLFPGQPSFINAVFVAHDRPTYASEYERIFKAPTRFSSGRNALDVCEAFFAARIPTANKLAHDIFSERAQSMLDRLLATGRMQSRVVEALAPVLHKGDCRLDRVAAELGFSPSSLHRGLKQEGSSFRAVVEELRRSTALRLLQQADKSLAEISFLVGFADPSAFSRAFKRWTGKTPDAYRRGSSP
jgi:AraC-like DNA-binding protein